MHFVVLWRNYRGVAVILTRRNSRTDRSARSPPARSMRLFGLEGTVGSAAVSTGARPVRSRIRRVSEAFKRKPSRSAAARSNRRRVGISRGRRRSSSKAIACSPGDVATARPPPRTGLPGHGQLRQQAADLCFPAGLFFARELRRGRERRGHGGIELTQKGHESRPDTITRMRRGLVTAVFPPGLSGSLQECGHLPACGTEQRTDDTSPIAFKSRRDAA